MKKLKRILALFLLATMLTSPALCEAMEAAMDVAVDTPIATPAPTPVAEAPDIVQITAQELPWQLTLVNASHAVPEDWNIEVVNLKRGQSVDARMYPALQQMFDDCRADGLLPLALSSFRTYDQQKQMLINKYNKFINQGYSHEDAQQEALKWAAYPGYSEHQLGLAVDIDSADTSKCSNQQVWDWMLAHCAEYGFIRRYPPDKVEITGISHEPWHFRYVGVDAAMYIMQNNLCLEEYLYEFYGVE